MRVDLTLLFFSLVVISIPGGAEPAAKSKVRYLFAATTPFNGELTLSKLVDTCADSSATFAESPTLNGALFSTAARQGATKTYEARKNAKLPSLLRASTADVEVYADTSPNFAHMFSDVVLREIAGKHRVTIALLRDDVAETIASLHAQRASLDLTAGSRNGSDMWRGVTPHIRLSDTVPHKSWSDSSDNEKIMDMILEMEAKRQSLRRYAQRRHLVNIVDIWRFETLNVDAAMYLLESRLHLKRCNSTQVQTIVSAAVADYAARSSCVGQQSACLVTHRAEWELHVSKARQRARKQTYVPATPVLKEPILDEDSKTDGRVGILCGSGNKFAGTQLAPRMSRPWILHSGIDTMMVANAVPEGTMLTMEAGTTAQVSVRRMTVGVQSDAFFALLPLHEPWKLEAETSLRLLMADGASGHHSSVRHRGHGVYMLFARAAQHQRSGAPNRGASVRLVEGSSKIDLADNKTVLLHPLRADIHLVPGASYNLTLTLEIIVGGTAGKFQDGPTPATISRHSASLLFEA